MAANPNETTEDQPPQSMSEDEAAAWYKGRMMAPLESLPLETAGYRTAALLVIGELIAHNHLRLVARTLTALGLMNLAKREVAYQRLKVRHSGTGPAAQPTPRQPPPTSYGVPIATETTVEVPPPAPPPAVKEPVTGAVKTPAEYGGKRCTLWAMTFVVPDHGLVKVQDMGREAYFSSEVLSEVPPQCPTTS